MRVRLSSLVAEEMTSLSKIIRGIQAQNLETHTISLQLQKEQLVEEEVVVEDYEKTMQDVIEERNRLFEEAQQQITLERQQFEQYQEEQLAKLEELKVVWEEEKVQLEQQAYEEAFSKGFEDGIQKANAQMAESVKAANETTKLAQINAKKYLEEQEQVILHLAIACAEKIIGYELNRTDEAFIQYVKRGLKEVRELQNIKVFVSNEQYATLTKYRDELAELFPPDVQFLIFMNDDLQDYQCYIETNHGRVIVSFDEQLQELKTKLREILDSKE